jgi:mannose-6-phosphate isomerase-like protein (cupin superfamily)
MDMNLPPGCLVRHLREATVVPCPCGTSRRNVTTITDSRKHHHLQSTEYYYILAGAGHMELDDQVIGLEPGTAVIIPPGCAHRAYGDLTCLIVIIPASEPGDEYFDEGS